jgi:hypothetical protein
MTTTTQFAGRFRPLLSPTEPPRVGLRPFPRRTLGVYGPLRYTSSNNRLPRSPASFACNISDHLSCLVALCRCDCHKELW